VDNQQLTEQQFNEIAKRVIATAPEGLDEAQFNALLDAEVDKFLAKPPVSTPRLPAMGRGTQLDVRKSNQWAKDNAPTIGATLATMATGGGALPLIAAATLGGAGGSFLRGDDATTALGEGALQGAMQGGLPLIGKLMRVTAKGLINANVPSRVTGEYLNQVDIPQQLLNYLAVPGVPASRAAMQALEKAAGLERTAAAETVPLMSPVRGVRDLGNLYRRALSGAVQKDQSKILAAASDAVNEMRRAFPMGVPGRAQLARKDIMQERAAAALRGSKALPANIANAQRSSIVSHLRETPRMEEALDKSQALKAVTDVMDEAAKRGNILHRFAQNGVTSALSSPMVNAIAAHAINQGSRAMNPDVARLLHALMNQRSQDE